jgi:hypothetical protein
MADDAVVPPEAGWSAGRTALVRLHHALGLSAAASAQLIGGISRNAVVSKRRRLGLMGANPLRSVRAALRRSAFPMLGLVGSPGRPSFGPDAVLRREPLPFMDLPPPLNAEPKRLTDRQRGECAWPLGPAEAPGDYRTLFCCAPVERGRSFCPVHRARACAPAPDQI